MITKNVAPSTWIQILTWSHSSTSNITYVSPSQLPFTTLTLLISSFYNQGFTRADGFAHGKIHGLIGGRALGREKGFEMWEELGFYEGFAKGWKSFRIGFGGYAKGHL